MTLNNLPAKFAREFNKSHIEDDRKKSSKRATKRKAKHKKLFDSYE